MRYNNYHCHKMYSNLSTKDSITKPVEYMDRAKELEHNTYFTTEHGWGGNIWEAYDLCKYNRLKCIFGAEAYYVDDRFSVDETLKKDRSNYHIILVALNNAGFKDINRIISLANTDGYYYKARIDMALLLSLNPRNVIITTACVGGRLREDEGAVEFLMKLKNHFKHFRDNLYIEVQAHVDSYQASYNRKMISYSEKYNIKLIHANDSHYIKPEDAKNRSLFLKAKGIVYEDEGNFILDYPDSDTIFDRYAKQGVLTHEQAEDAINNTLIFDKCEDLNLSYEVKMPKVLGDNANQQLKAIVSKSWRKERLFIPRERWNEYKEAIKYEMDIIEKTNMEEYFLLDYTIVKLAIEKYGAVLTKTGRGSSPSFYITKLLGLTDIDRLESPITLYPTRFMSTARINESKSLPDIDLNFADTDPVLQASKDILGEDGCYYMISYKPLQNSSAFRLWCKAQGMEIDSYNQIAKNLDNYVEDPKWKQIIEDSKIFVGVVESVSPSPCSFLLLDKPISEEVGLMKVGDIICCTIDGYNATEKYKFLKNDYLTVSVVDIIAKTFALIDKPVPSIRELNGLLDDKVWDIYKKGLTATLNQADSDYAKPLVMKYSPTSVAEMSAWVASIRPAFASLLENFLHRRPYTTHVRELDILLKDSFGYIMYQESIMKLLIWLGIDEPSSYDILKKIAKKKFKEKELAELKAKLIKGWMLRTGSEQFFDETWQVVEDASKYAFNASHSLSVATDSLYGAYLKSHFPLEYYTVILNHYQADTERTAKITAELPHFDIKVFPPAFRFSKSEYGLDKATNSIYKGLCSVKYLNETVAGELYDLGYKKYDNFMELLVDLKETSINSRQLAILVKIKFFAEFGKTQKLMDCIKYFEAVYGKKQFKQGGLGDLFPFTSIINEYSTKTAKLFKNLDTDIILKEIYATIADEELPIIELVQCEFENMGYITSTTTELSREYLLVTDINTKYKTVVYLFVYRLCDGMKTTLKLKAKDYHEQVIEQFDVIKYVSIETKNKKKKISEIDANGEVQEKWVVSEETETWLYKWSKLLFN